jgi:hypothetical protein
MSDTLSDDPRWRRLHERAWTCAGCRNSHTGLFDLASDRPYHWGGGAPRPNEELAGATSILTEDFCIQDGDYFVRCVLQLPIVGGDGAYFGFGVWSTLSKANFERYVESFDDGAQGSLGPWFGWFCSRLKGYPDTVHLECSVHPQNERRRPLIELGPAEHPLAAEQRQGITFDRVLELYALNGHDLRSALTD